MKPMVAEIFIKQAQNWQEFNKFVDPFQCKLRAKRKKIHQMLSKYENFTRTWLRAHAFFQLWIAGSWACGGLEFQHLLPDVYSEVPSLV